MTVKTTGGSCQAILEVQGRERFLDRIPRFTDDELSALIEPCHVAKFSGS